MRSYLADKHTHLEAPIGVKKPYIRVRSGIIIEERDEDKWTIRMK